MSLTAPSIEDLLDLTGRTAVVTGGAMGIGRAIVERLAEARASVVIADADLETAETTAKELVERGLDVLAMRADVGDEDEVHRLIADTIEWRGQIDILVNNAGIFPVKPVLEMSADEFDRVIRTNLRGVFLCSKEAALRMRENKTGRIINVTSIDALHPSNVGLAHYDATKHAAWGFTKNLALELAPHGIWVNAIAPGAIATPGVRHLQESSQTGAVDPEEMLERFLAKVPMRRMGAADDIARVALFLASDLSSFLTGTQIVADGGVLLS